MMSADSAHKLGLMARRRLCCVAAVVLCAAAVALTVATSRMAHSPWCDGPTLLPSVLCSLHPTRWVGKGYYPKNLFKSRKGRAGANPPPEGPTTNLDAATDFGETAGGGLPQPRQLADIPQPQQPADVPEMPAAAKLDAVVQQMEAGGSPDDAGSAAQQGGDGSGKQPNVPEEQQQQDQPQGPGHQLQQEADEPAAE